MLRVLIRISSSKISTTSCGKINNRLHVLKSKYGGTKSSIVSTYEMNIVQARFCSSESSQSIFQKELFFDAASTSTTDTTPTIPTDTTSTTIPTDAVDASTSGRALSEGVEYIPAPPVPPEGFEFEVLNAIGEPTFESLGLGGWTPIGLIQSGIEYLHVDIGLPWWGTIAITTIILRSCLFPLVIKGQRHTANMSNHMPMIQALQKKMSEARSTGNEIEATRVAYELQQFMQKNNVKPLRGLMMPLAQAPIFISMFIGLRRCANLPIESFRTGGTLWFTDLTISDPYFILPMVTSLTMLATIELGIDGQRAADGSMMVKYGLRALPCVVFPFVLWFPSAMLCYWVTTNIFSLIQVGFLRVPQVRDYFGIPQRIAQPPSTESKKGFVQNVRESWSNMKHVTTITERERMDRVNFEKAGHDSLVKTYKQNPTKKRKPIDVKVHLKK